MHGFAGVVAELTPGAVGTDRKVPVDMTDTRSLEASVSVGFD